MESAPHVRGRGRGNGQVHSRNRQWVGGENGQRSGSSTPYHSDSDRWERGGHKGGHRGRGAHRGRGKFPNVSLRVTPTPRPTQVDSLEPEDAMAEEDMDEPVETHTEDEGFEEPEEPVLETPEEREKFYQTLVKAREVERKKAISEGKMDDPTVAKRLEDAITVVGTCTDMCPRFERYRRERENNLFQWETVPGTKRVDHKRAVKMYERAAGDKTLPSDLRPPPVLKKTLDYLFHELLPQNGFTATYDFIRDRSRSVRNDFTMQHSYGPEAIECHDRCARFHILALHLGRDIKGFSIPLEEQQLMNTLQSLKEFYEDQRGRYQSPTELEMRVYHRLIHIRDQKERHEDIPEHISSHPVFKLTTQFRLHVQRKSAPINKTSVLKVDDEGMQIFGELAQVLREQGSVVMIYLVACILERLFGKDAIDDIDAIQGDLSISDIIDGTSASEHEYAGEEEHEEPIHDEEHEIQDDVLELTDEDVEEEASASHQQPATNVFGTATSPFGALSAGSSSLPATSAFSAIKTTPNAFSVPSPFGSFPASSTPLFGSATSIFGQPTPPSQIATTSNIAPTNVFGTNNVFTISTPGPSQSPPTTSPVNLTKSMPAPLKDPTDSIVTNSTPYATPTFGIFGKATSLANGSTSTSTQASAPSTLNPMAAPFTPQFESLPAKTPIPFASTPTGALFQRSSNPSPSPKPLNSDAPPTPPVLCPTPATFPPPSSSPFPPPSLQWTPSIPPVLPKINTSASATQQPLPTPTEPPPSPKLHPISLPPTPTVAPPPKTILNFFKGSITTPTSSTTSNQGMLSPLFMPSPTTAGLQEFPFNRKSPTKGSAGQPSSLLLDINTKAKPSTKPKFNEEDMKNKSAAFERKSMVVRTCLRRWHERIVERIAWIEACRQSDAYKQKLKRQQQLPAPSKKKRRISGGPGMVIESPVRKRLRRRVSSEYHPPRSDDELAQRFKENHEEHERRWAQGSFLKVITHHVESKLNGTLPHPSWRIWLSMNPDIDATAIWLERKFDVPVSGDWATEAVFSIPLIRTTHRDSPGIIIFECTSLEGVTDDLERKYRILDDCARLRDLVKAFPETRHFIPSLLIISWREPEQTASTTDFTEMVNQLVESHLIEAFQTFAITSTTKDLDGKFGEALNSLTLDLQGKLVRALNTRGTFKLFEPSFTSFISEWIETCAANDHFNWHLFTLLVQAAISIINSAVRAVGGLLSEQPPPQGILPKFDIGPLTGNVSAYDRSVEWLSVIDGFAGTIAQDLQAHRDIGLDFPSRDFFVGLWDLAQSQMEIWIRKDEGAKVYVPIENISAAVEALDKEYEPHRTLLGRSLHLSVRRSPVVNRRRSFTTDTESEVMSSQSKRRRLFSPVEQDNPSEMDDLTPSPYVNGINEVSPSPSISNVSLDQSEPTTITTPTAPASGVVTVAMLRALTKDVKKRYSMPSSMSVSS